MSDLAIRVGMPRGLLHYYYGSYWESFLQQMGADVFVSNETSAATIADGSVLDEVCLPVKAFYGHAVELSYQVDYLFIPRCISVAKQQYNCPKLIALPDMVRSNLANPPAMLDPVINIRRSSLSMWEAAAEIGAVFGKSPLVSLRAWNKSRRELTNHKTVNFAEGQPGNNTPLDPVNESNIRIALISHPYIVFDRQLSFDILGKLRGWGVSVITQDMVSPGWVNQAVSGLAKKMFWTYTERLMGAALALLENSAVDGLIFLTCFCCGPDSLAGEMIGDKAARAGIPYLGLSLDEHSAEAGFVTRLEAFVDMLNWRANG